MRTTRPNDARRGAALLVAIALVGLFSLLGTAWVQYALIDSDESYLKLDQVQARQVAAAGVQAAIAELDAAIAAGEVSALLTSAQEYPVPVYRAGDDGGAPNADNARSGLATVAVTDEAARVNLNFVPPAVLSRILNVDGETAREIRRALPGSGGEGQWLTHIDDLVTRGLLGDAAFDALNANHLTVYTVSDPANPAGFVNVNTASREVLEAVLDVPGDVATRVMAARPIESLDQLGTLTGKDPATFGVRIESDAPGAVPKALALSSRCYRIRSEGVVNRTDDGGTADALYTQSVEAVVYLPEDGAPRIMYWNQVMGQQAQSAEEAAGDTESTETQAADA